MKRLISAVLTVVSIILILFGIFMAITPLHKVMLIINGTDSFGVTNIVLPLLLAGAFFFSGKKLFFHSFYSMIRK